MMFAGRPCIQKKGVPDAEQLQEMEELQRTIMVYRSHPDYTAPEKFIDGIKDLLNSGSLLMPGVQ